MHLSTALTVCAVALAATAIQPVTTPVAEELEMVASVPDAAMSGVTVEPDGRVFANMPQWTEAASPALPRSQMIARYLTTSVEHCRRNPGIGHEELVGARILQYSGVRARSPELCEILVRPDVGLLRLVT